MDGTMCAFVPAVFIERRCSDMASLGAVWPKSPKMDQDPRLYHIEYESCPGNWYRISDLLFALFSGSMCSCALQAPVRTRLLGAFLRGHDY